MRQKRQLTRKRIIDAAYLLFWQRGFTRVNVDEISDAAGITKRTLYSHFDSKDALLKAVLDDQHERAFAAFQTFGRKLTGNPEEIVGAFFKDLLQWSGKPKFPGSGFTRLAMELADLPGHPARRIASRHKQMVERYLATVLAKAGLRDANKHARQLWILAEGSVALVLIHGDRGYFTAAEEAALSLVRMR